jgi:hypothetical protein
MGKQPTPNSFSKNTIVRSWHGKVAKRETITQSLCLNYILYFYNLFLNFWIFSLHLFKGKKSCCLWFLQFIFAWIKMMIPNCANCNNYSIFIHMKKIQKILDQFWELLFDLLKNSRVAASVKLMYSQPQMLIKIIYILICHSWMHIASQSLVHMRNIES